MQQYPPDQQPQQPYYPPPPYQQPPQPPKKRRTGLWIVLGIIGFLLFACVGFASLASKSVQPTTTTTTSNVPQATTVPTQVASTNTIGKPVVVNSDWTVTLNKVSTSQGSELDKPKAGNVLLVVNVTLLNTSGSTQNASTLIQWALNDSTGQKYDQDIFFGKGPDGTVAVNGIIRGNIAYEVPKSVHSFTLQFVSGLGSSDLAEWNVSI